LKINIYSCLKININHIDVITLGKSFVKQVMLGSIGKKQHAIAFLEVNFSYKENSTYLFNGMQKLLTQAHPNNAYICDWICKNPPCTHKN